MIRRTFVATVVGVSVVAAIGVAAGPSAGQQNSDAPAAAKNYWAFRLPVQAALPDVSGRFENPIDRFLEHSPARKGAPAGAARPSRASCCAARTSI